MGSNDTNFKNNKFIEVFYLTLNNQNIVKPKELDNFYSLQKFMYKITHKKKIK